MNFSAILSEIQQGNDYGMFSQNQAVNRWGQYRYGQVWGAADWPFKTAAPTSLAVVGGTVTVAPPSDCFKPIFLFDEQDNPLTEIAPIEFFRQFGTLAATSSGRPTHYCFINGQFYLGPTPSSSVTFKLVYERRPFTFSFDGVTVVPGGWDGASGTGLPCWDASHHYILVHGMAATGYSYIGSPLSSVHEQFFNDGLQRLIAFYAPFDHRSNYQFSRDSLD